MRVRYLGKKSSLNSFMKTLSDLSASERAQAGKDLNQLPLENLNAKDRIYDIF